ncbi:MAG: hypothetical protein WBQ26_10680 [Gemmatimonadaceae bacterium]|nr:hypothetical protein [Gemmatimonadaceae bacterium]
MRLEDMFVAIAGVALTAYIFRGIFSLIARYLDARARPVMGSETEQRIARIEQAVDAIAVEVERISEGQRFTTRLLSDRAAPSVHPPSKPGVPS